MGLVRVHYVGIQWGSEIRTNPDFEWSKIGCFANGSDFEWDMKSEAQPFEIRTNGYHLVNKFEILKKMSGFQMVGTIAIAKSKALPFEN